MTQSRGTLALAAMRLGDRDRAEQKALEALNTLRHLGTLTSHALLEGCCGVAEVVITAEREEWPHRTREFWGRAVRSAVDVLDRYRRKFPVGAGRYFLWKGVAAENRGEKREARKCWEEGLAVAVELGLGGDVERLSRRLGRVGP
jgi:hypothetical protein